MDRVPRHVAQQDVVFDWAEKWLQLIRLINDATGVPYPPSISDEVEYHLLRSWFMSHEREFEPIWRELSESTGDVPQNCADECDMYLEEGNVYEDYMNPFRLFYEPSDLYQLAVSLELQSSTYIWEPNESVVCMVRPLMVMLGKSMLNLIDRGRFADLSPVKSKGKTGQQT